MNEITAKILAKELEDAAKKLRAGTCSLTEEEAINLIDSVTHIEMNKEEACNYLKVSRDTFDRHVNLGHIPKGIKSKTIKVHVWYKDQLRKFKDRLTR